MNEISRRQPYWYWGIVALLLFVGAGALSSGEKQPTAILNRPELARRELDQEDTGGNLIRDFKRFRAEVSQLTVTEQRAVWQSLRRRSESVAEQTYYTFFAQPEGEQQELLDRAIDRIDQRRRLGKRRGFRGAENSTPWPVREVSNGSDLDRPFAELSLEERLAAQRDHWEETTLQSDAMRSEFLRLMNKRRQKRDISDPLFHQSG